MTVSDTVSLGDVSNIQAGIGFPVALQGRKQGKYPFAKVADITRATRFCNGELDDAENYVGDNDLVSLRAQVIPVGSVVFAKIGEAIRKNNRAIVMRPLLVDNNVISVQPDTSVLDVRYLYYFLLQLDLYPLANVTSVPAIRKSSLARILIPLPGIVEQRRIAGILDQANDLLLKRRQSIALLDNLGWSIFSQMFGDLVGNEYSWSVGLISDIVKGFESGKSLAEGQDDTASRYRILKISAVTSGRFKAQESKSAPEGYEPPKSHFVRGGDLLFSRANTSELIGATAFVPSGTENLLMPDKLWRFVWNDGKNKPSPWFVHYVFRQPSVRDVIRRNASGSSGSMKNISQSKVLSMKIGIPPAQLQNEFERKILEVEALRQSAESEAGAFDDLFRSLQEMAFSGKL